MDDRSRMLTAAGLGAVLGGLWGWLYLTESGGAVRGRIRPTIDRFAGDVKEARSTADKARAALQEARTALTDSGVLEHA